VPWLLMQLPHQIIKVENKEKKRREYEYAMQCNAECDIYQLKSRTLSRLVRWNGGNSSFLQSFWSAEQKSI
jgi:hypothetical protein